MAVSVVGSALRFGADFVTSSSSSHTVAAGTDCLAVAIGGASSGASVTYGGVALTLIRQNGTVSIWRLLAPTVGTATLLCSHASQQSWIVSAWNLSGVHQSVPVAADAGVASSFGANVSRSISTPADGLAVDCLLISNGIAATPNAGQTGDGLYVGGSNKAWSSYKAAAASMGWTHTESVSYAHVVVAFAAAAAPAGFTGGATLGAVVASGSLQSVMSGFTAAATLGAVVAGGSLGPTPGVFVLGPIKVNGAAQAGAAIDWVRIYSDAGILLYERTGGTLDGSGSTTLTTSSAPPGTAVRIDWQLSSGRRRMPRVTMG